MLRLRQGDDHLHGDDDRLGPMLSTLENAGFGYRLAVIPGFEPADRQYQDIAVVAYPKAPAPS